jgi:hypothetical protein
MSSFVTRKNNLKCCKSKVTYKRKKKKINSAGTSAREYRISTTLKFLSFRSVRRYRAPSVSFNRGQVSFRMFDCSPTLSSFLHERGTSVCMPFPKPAVARETTFALLTAALRSYSRGGSLPWCDIVLQKRKKKKLPKWITHEQIFLVQGTW